MFFRSSLTAALGPLRAPDVVAAMGRVPPVARLLLPAVGGLLAGLVTRLAARGHRDHGVSDVMEAVVFGRVRLSMRATLVKSVSSWLAIAFGNSIGREGPLIQFGGAAGQMTSRWLRLPPANAQLLVAAGTAAGFAAAYNTPFAAVLFVLEIVTGVVVLDAILPILVATVIAVMVTRAFIGAGPIYGHRSFEVVSPLELVAFAGLGIVTAFGAQAFMRLVTGGERLFRTPRLPLPWRTALGGLLAGTIVMGLPEVAGNGYEPLNHLLDGRFAIALVLLIVLGKALATTASVASGIPGGVFTPTLLIGGALGTLYSHGLAWCGLRIGAPGGYALVGMAAAIAATTHAPLMAAVMAFELSGDYPIVLPLILTTAVATLVSRRLRRDSIYAAELRQRGVEWEVSLEGGRIRPDTDRPANR